MPNNPAIFSFDALGTRWWLERLDGEPWNSGCKQTINSTVKQFVKRYSRFDPKSMLSRLSTTGQLADPPSEMLDMLNFARKIFVLSDGAFNISVGSALQRSGYGPTGQTGDVIDNVWDHLSCSEDEIRSVAGVTLDFGGFGKGWLIDKLVRIIRDHKISQFIVNGGGDLYVYSSEPVRLMLEHPLNPGQGIGYTTMSRGALAASSTLKRVWDTNKHHIIDPKAKRSSESEIVASFVRAETALLADTMATVVIIRPDLTDKLSQELNFNAMLLTKSQLGI